MVPFHNNKLNMVGLFEEEDLAVSNPFRQQTMYAFGASTSGAAQTIVSGPYKAAMDPDGKKMFPAYVPQTGGQSSSAVSHSPKHDSEYAESDQDGRPASKIPKTNKDGAPRKPRQPRPKLLKWSDDDWKNVVLGIIWACGETGVQIPFDQAAQVVGQNCTAGALQQAVLKLRGKQISEGFQIPSLRMAWTRKNKNSALSSSDANDKTEQGPSTNVASTTLMQGTQSLIVTLKRAYPHTNRVHKVRNSRKKKKPVGMIHAEHPLPSSMTSEVSAQPSGGPPAATSRTRPSSSVRDDLHGANLVEDSVQKQLGGYILPGFEYTDALKVDLSDDLSDDTTPLLSLPWVPEHDQGNVQGNDHDDTEDLEYHPALEHQPVGCLGGFLSDMTNGGFAYDPFHSMLPGSLQGPPQQVPSQLGVDQFPGFLSYDTFVNDNFCQGSFADIFKAEASDFDGSHFN